MVLAHRVVELVAITAIELAELRVLVALRILLFVLAPELIESEIELLVGFELAVDVIEIGQRFCRRFDDNQRRKQFLLQRLFGQVLRQRPEKPRFLRPFLIVCDGAAADV